VAKRHRNGACRISRLDIHSSRVDNYEVTRSIYPNGRFHIREQSYSLFRDLTMKNMPRQTLHYCQTSYLRWCEKKGRSPIFLGRTELIDASV
jgi:hypothetical protein